MKDKISVYRSNAVELFQKAKADIAADLKARGIGMLLWDNAQTNFHYLPEIIVKNGTKADILPIMGLYLYNDVAYLIEDVENAPVHIRDFYNRGLEVRPVAVTLDISDARARIGDPEGKPGLTTGGTLEEWLAIADCYYQALNDLPD